jgi:Ni,Fe-hydrogenase I small subunit
VSQIRSFCKCGHARLDHQVEWHDGGGMPCLQCACRNFDPEDDEKESRMHRDDLGDLVLLVVGLLSIPFYMILHPVKTYNLLVHKIGWYDWCDEAFPG